MLTFNLLKHELKKGFRAQSFYRSLAVKLFMGFMALYFITAFVIIGFGLGHILEESNETLKPLEVLNGASLYILLGILTLRFFVQSLTVINLDHYVTLPVKRNVLVNLTLLKPLFMPINYAVLLVAVPFAFKSVLSWYSGVEVAQFLINTVALIWVNMWLVFYLKRRFGGSIWGGLGLLALIVLLATLESAKLFSLFDLSVKVFGFLTITRFGFLVSLLLAVLAYGLNRLFYSRNYYSEKFSEKLLKDENKVTRRLTFLEKYGLLGDLLQLQIQLILRHKRSKQMLYMGALFLLYGLLFYTNDLYEENVGMLIFIALILTGMMSMMYGQWIIGWDSNHFDGLMTKNVPVEKYIKSFYVLLLSLNIISFVLTTPYFYFGWRIVYLHIGMLLYNSGISAFLLVFLATFNSKRIDLMAKSSFNFQGTTMKNFLIMIPVMLFPMIFASIMSNFISIERVAVILGVIGLVGLLLLPWQIKLTVKQFNRRKYIIAQGFREKD